MRGSPVLNTALVGRAGVVEVVRHAIGRVQPGQGGTLLIGGEAGIGKSRLTREAARLAEARGFQFVRGSCFPNDMQCPFAPLLDLLRDELAHDRYGDRAFLTKERLALLPELFAAETPLPMSANAEMEKRRIFAVLCALLERRTQIAPVLCVIEDLHWSDEASLEFLHYLARRVATLPLLLVATYRNDEMPRALVHWLAQFERERLAREIRLERLSRAEVETLMTTLLEPVAPLRHEFVVNVHALTEGNPYFVEETLKALPAGSETTAALDLGKLHSVQAMVQSRFAQLPRAVRKLATTAAVIGREFDFALLQGLSEHQEDALLEEIHVLVEAQLIVERSPDRFAFRHALTREAIYALLLARERRELHRRAGAIIERLHGGTLDAQVVDLAYHYGEAGERDKVFRYASIAGEQALIRYLPAAAVNHLTTAIDAAQNLGMPVPGRLLAQRARAREMVGDFEGARADLEAVLADARRAGDGREEWEALVSLGYLWSARDYVRTGEYYQLALEMAGRLNDVRMLARSLNHLGNWHANSEQHAQARERHLKAMAIYKQLNDERGIVETVDLLAMARFLAGDAFEGAEYARRAVAAYESNGDRAGLASCLAVTALFGLTVQTERIALPAQPAAELTENVLRALRIANESGLRNAVAFAAGVAALILDGQGEHGRALAHAREELAIALETNHRQWVIVAHYGLGSILANVLALTEARENFEKGLALAIECNATFWQLMISGALVSVLVEMGELDLAERSFSAGFDLAAPPLSIAQRLNWAAYCELRIAHGDHEGALEIVRSLATHATGIERSIDGVMPGLHLLRARCLVAMGRLAEAREALHALKFHLIANGARPLLWRTLLVEADMHRRQGDASEERKCLAEAREITESLAISIVDQTAGGELGEENTRIQNAFVEGIARKIPVQRRIARDAAKSQRGGLTAREWEVATLVAQGDSNREIGEALVLSERTVETHISNILGKLDLRSRAQLTAWMIERRGS